MRPRLLTLESGAIVRGRARLSIRDGQWRVLTSRGWQEFPQDTVTRTALERDVLADAQVRRRGVGRHDLTERLAVAEWMLEQGLATEAIKELLELGTLSSGADQDLVITGLLSCGARHRNELEQLLHAESQALQPQRRAFAAEALRRLFPADSAGL